MGWGFCVYFMMFFGFCMSFQSKMKLLHVCPNPSWFAKFNSLIAAILRFRVLVALKPLHRVLY